MPPKPVTEDVYALYEAAVQCVDADLDFVAKLYRKRNGRPPRDVREDFCGTASLACEWVRRDDSHRAWGVDLDSATLKWGRKHRVATLPDAAGRVTLIRADVREARTPPVDVVFALNFSYWVLRKRSDLLEYFRAVRHVLRPGGLFVMDLFGGTEATEPTMEKSRKPASMQPDGRKTPPFTYIWEQASFNPADHHMVCHIHFRLGNGKKIRKAFTYHWRMWTLPELRDILDDAGFAASDTYVDRWDDDAGETDGIYRRRTRFENQESWVAYLVGSV